jgi:hypothetical protein
MGKAGRIKSIVVTCFLLIGVTSRATITHKNCDKECLTKVFTKKKDSEKQLILKLYCNNDYELLSFSLIKKKKIERRETGYFKHFGSILKFIPTKKVSQIHYDFLFLKKNGELHINFLDLFNNKNSSLLSENTNKKYFDSTYVDPVFGVISTIKNDEKKFIERPKKLWYPRYTESENYISEDSLNLIKAVFVIGELETEDIPNRILELAEYVKSKGVNVTVYTSPTAWKTIVEGSKNAHIFLYAGHGNGDGFYLSQGQISSEEIKRDLKLHKNAIVLFNHVCYGAGSSAGDNSQISDEEATKRVEEYSKTFIGLGAGGYYANNINNCMYAFFDSFFSKNPIKHIVMNHRLIDYNVVVTDAPYKYNSAFEILVTRNDYCEGYSTVTTYRNGVKSVSKRKSFPRHSQAFVGNSQLTIIDLLKE